jgi:hypothetical protein
VSSPRIEDLRDRLAAIAEELADAATDTLREAIDSPEEHERLGLAALERRITKARRAVDKARAVLAT